MEIPGRQGPQSSVTNHPLSTSRARKTVDNTTKNLKEYNTRKQSNIRGLKLLHSLPATTADIMDHTPETLQKSLDGYLQTEPHQPGRGGLRVALSNSLTDVSARTH